MIVFSLGIVLGLIIILQVATKALINAWHNRGLPFIAPEKSWGWWIEVRTLCPDYVYYFGPFLSKIDAQRSKLGYSQDLESEGSKIISTNIKWCKPSQLTICTEELLKIP
jgi:Domain of unknown function (DUF1816)